MTRRGTGGWRSRAWSRRLGRAATLPMALVALGAVGAMVASPVAAIPPEPEPVPRKWQLDVKAGPLRVATVEVPNVGPRRFYYMTYKVVNATGEDVLFAPIFEMSTSEGDILRSGREVPAEATRKILEMNGNAFLQDQIAILGVLLQGDANAKEGLVVWPATALDTEAVTVYGAGFSGEARTIEVIDPTTKAARRVLLRKTLMLRYRTPGDLTNIGSTPLDLVEQRWIMR